ncbi:hypothetical protein [Actinoallomurus iriomotensis]|uniref:Tetratricopeptide repeat protein n=1 Tax=Actinoallomurus iriomotensis TaxID=478107 RepID=A0A9W6VW02_9ACTN|nr:hypothetical protein [Actinoallomurus iriomotensis]GLY81714.1 hypothetical protein Airi01_099810 [Actinoallomurus iriomotensis]
MSAESDRRDGDDDDRRQRQNKDRRPGGAGGARGRQSGGRDSAGGRQARGPRRDGSAGRTGSGGTGGNAKGRDFSKPRDKGRDDGRPTSRRPRPFRNDSETSYRDRPRQRDEAGSGPYGKRDDSRRTPRPGGGRGSDSSYRDRPRQRDEAGSGPYGKRDDSRRTPRPGGGRGSEGRDQERRDGGFQRRDRTSGGRPRPEGAPNDRRGESSGRRQGARTGAGAPGRDTTGRPGGGRREGGRPGDRGRRPADRRGAAGGSRKPFERRPEDETRPRRDPGPPVPDDVTGDELDRAAKAELRTLPKDLAKAVARHLVMAGRLLDEDAEQAYQHTLAARRKAARVGVVREACGLAAYHAGLWSVALSELRTARRLTGQEAYLSVMADAERGLGRPERALDLARSDEAKRLPPAEAIEMRIVESGARRDLGQHDAAVLALQIPELKDERLRPWSARLFYAYADALADAGREEEAADWFARAAAADRDGETDAAERYAEIEGLEIIDDDSEDG